MQCIVDGHADSANIINSLSLSRTGSTLTITVNGRSASSTISTASQPISSQFSGTYSVYERGSNTSISGSVAWTILDAEALVGLTAHLDATITLGGTAVGNWYGSTGCGASVDLSNEQLLSGTYSGLSGGGNWWSLEVSSVTGYASLRLSDGSTYAGSW